MTSATRSVLNSLCLHFLLCSFYWILNNRLCIFVKYNYNSGEPYFTWKVREYVSPSAGSFSPDVNVVTTNTTISQTSGYVIYDASSGSGNITLAAPTAVANTAVYVIKNSGATYDVIFDCAGSETIDGAGTFTINAGDSITVYSDGSNYKIV